MTPPRVTNTHMTKHVLQQQNTPTRGQPSSHLSRYSTHIQQRTTNTAAPVINTILKMTAPSSCINTQTMRHNLQWNSPIDTEFTTATSHQGTANNDVRYMNLSSNQLAIPAMQQVTTIPYQLTPTTQKTVENLLCDSDAESKDTNSKGAGNKTSSAPNVNVTTTIQKPVEDTQPQQPKHCQRQE